MTTTNVWNEVRPGVFLCVLRDHGASGERAVRLRMRPGARFPRHRHPGGEQLFVVSGTACVGGAELAAGDYLYTAPGDAHDVSSPQGCELFITVARPIELLEP